jgi:hypothetical protein
LYAKTPKKFSLLQAFCFCRIRRKELALLKIIIAEKAEETAALVNPKPFFNLAKPIQFD